MYFFYREEKGKRGQHQFVKELLPMMKEDLEHSNGQTNNSIFIS